MQKRKCNTKYYVDNNGKRRKIGSWTYVKNLSIRAWAKNKEKDILAGVEKNTNGEGHVYIFSLGRDNLYKIGCTKNVQQRLKALQASNPVMRCVWSAWVKDMHRIEKTIHENYKKCCLDREIFSLTRDQIFSIDRYVGDMKSNY
jgi:hypothetical protein